MQPEIGERRWLVCFAAVPLLGVAAGVYAPDHSLWTERSGAVAAEAGSRLIAGQLQALTSRRMAVESHGETVLFRVSHQTRVTIDGRKAALRDLEHRQFVEVTAEEQGQDLTASAIAARSKMHAR